MARPIPLYEPAEIFVSTCLAIAGLAAAVGIVAIAIIGAAS